MRYLGPMGKGRGEVGEGDGAGEGAAVGEARGAAPAADGSKVVRRRVLLATLASVTAVPAGVIGTDDEIRARLRRASAHRADDRPGLLVPGAVVTERRRLGRTGLQVSPVGIGAGNIDSTEVLRRAADLGINYIDTATCYGASEDVIGRAIEGTPGLRDKLVLATKWDPGPTTPKAKMLESLDKSLKRLKVDHVDVMQIHWLGGEHARGDDGYNRLENPALYEAMEEARRAGKVRFFGATSHHADRGKILRNAIGKKIFDMVLVKMNVVDMDGIPELLAHAAKHDVGVVAMKSQPGGAVVPKGFETSRFSIYQANLRFCLEQGAACVVESKIGSDPATQDLAVGATREKLGRADTELLERYAEAVSPLVCRDCASGCHDACPAGVAIGEVLRYAMYDEQYGWPGRARERYHELAPSKRWSEACLSCEACTEACGYGVDAAARVRRAHERLG